MGFSCILIASDYYERKTCIISIRAGALAFLVGMSLIVLFLGIISPWLFVQFSISGAGHLYIFIRALKLRNDPYFLYSSLPVRRQPNLDQEMG